MSILLVDSQGSIIPQAPIDTTPAKAVASDRFCCALQLIIDLISSIFFKLVEPVIALFTGKNAAERAVDTDYTNLFNRLLEHETLKQVAAEHPNTKCNAIFQHVVNNINDCLVEEEGNYQLFGLTEKAEGNFNLWSASRDWLGGEFSSIANRFSRTDTIRLLSYEDAGMLQSFLNVMHLMHIGFSKIEISQIAADEAQFVKFKALVSKLAAERGVQVTFPAHTADAQVDLITAIGLTDHEAHKKALSALNDQLSEQGGLLIGIDDYTACLTNRE